MADAPTHTMDFFEHQDRARKNSARLVVIFIIGVIAIAVAVHLLVTSALAITVATQFENDAPLPRGWTDIALHPLLLVTTLGGTVAIIGLSSAWRLATLRSGGSVVAESLGGRLVNTETDDPDERRVLNVVEEMSIASGVTCPPVFLLNDEKGINAFAAGYSPNSAVVGVTRGTAVILDRDELQGVVAHEFSHILNGDMRLNIRALGVLHGIFVIALIGRGLLHALRFSHVSAGRGRKGGGGGAVILVMLALGLGLLAIGAVGSFFGTLIQSAISRQREYLADASAVQFTRNPAGIAGALRKIGGYPHRARVRDAHAQETAHMFFGQAVTSGFSGLFATHPPLKERIRRIDPRWDGSLPEVEVPASLQPGGGVPLSAFATEPAPAPEGARAPEVPGATETLAAISLIGQPTPAHIRHARQLRERIPEALREAAHSPYSARAVVYALLISRDRQVADAQLRHLAQRAEAGLADETRRLMPHTASLDGACRLPLIDITLGALRNLTTKQHTRFDAITRDLMRADRRIDLFEWTLQRIVLRTLHEHFGRRRRQPAHYYSLARLGAPCAVLLTVIARVGHEDDEGARAAFERGARMLGVNDCVFQSREVCTLDRLDDALETLVRTAPKLRKRLIEAAAACIVHDERITVREAEVFRAIASNLDCPMPPVLPGQPLA